MMRKTTKAKGSVLYRNVVEIYSDISRIPSLASADSCGNPAHCMSIQMTASKIRNTRPGEESSRAIGLREWMSMIAYQLPLVQQMKTSLHSVFFNAMSISL